MKRVTGIGGIFFKTKNPSKTREWYNKHLGINTDEWGSAFEWRHADEGVNKGFTQWSPMDENSEHYTPSTKDFMINYRVHDLEWLVEELKKEGVTILDNIESFSYGKFIHILDPDGQKIELWEPNDNEFDKISTSRTK